MLLLCVAACGDARYYSAGELDAKPYPLAQVDPGYPVTADGAQYYGRIRLNVYITTRGRVDRVEVVEASVPPAFRDAAVSAFSQARWEPGRKDGRRVNSVKVVEVSFEPPVKMPRAPMSPES